MVMRKIRVLNAVGGAGSPKFWTAWLAALERAGFDVFEQACKPGAFKAGLCQLFDAYNAA